MSVGLSGGNGRKSGERVKSEMGIESVSGAGGKIPVVGDETLDEGWRLDGNTKSEGDSLADPGTGGKKVRECEGEDEVVVEELDETETGGEEM